ncbi:MAG: hypothetical protein DME05_01625 [Candidatus Rokuibacteriota bacterium]|nr:MAG: hypothetical protein DME05_01625 [Candidatus Rokubacteria bacterium]
MPSAPAFQPRSGAPRRAIARSRRRRRQPRRGRRRGRSTTRARRSRPRASRTRVPRERRGAGEHVRERGAGVGDRVDVEEDRARDMRLGELGPRVAAELRHVPRAVDHADVPPTQVGGEPLGGDERRGRAAHRMVLSVALWRCRVWISFRITSG